ncbi:hypothetical protein L208DRAFT_909131 [Tricholoma matsutake]|nr:hypothetical protein L208DRAFT_909131 [Tricholoma matsutake 945]
MAPSIIDHTAAPPGYASQRDSTSLNESVDDLVSAQTHLPPRPPSISSAQATPRHSEVHFNEGSPVIQRSRTAVSRRRYASLPYGGSTVTFPVHLSYHPSDVGSTIDVLDPESEQEHPALGNPSMQHLHEKLSSGAPASRGPGTTIRLNPANYISLSRKGTPNRFQALARASASIKGKFTVNPYLHVPAALLAPLPGLSGRDVADGLRKNLKFEVENGGIDVEIFLVGEPELGAGDPDAPVLRTTLDLKIRNNAGPGSAKNNFPLIAKIHTPTLHRPPFHLIASAHDGYLSLHLPPSFHGLLTVTIKLNHGPPHNCPHLPLDAHISLSPTFAQNSMILSETGMTRAYFVGEMGGWAREQQSWEGDRVDVGVGAGLVRLQVLGERDLDTVRKVWWRIGI